MNSRNAPLSPISVGSSEWLDYPMDNSGPYPSSRGVISPPSSGGSVGGMNGGFPTGPKSVGGPSPPPSVGRSSTGTNLYARSETGRSQSSVNSDATLGEHYLALKRFLSQTSRDGKPTNPANKARDKLQRLTGIQFLELSTDVFDELVRRQAFARRPPNAPPNAGPPSYLLPEDTFHPKRNQARQKLSSLGPPRFRDLATDVFCELERRFPRFVAGDIPRMGSPSAMSVRGPTRTGTPSNGFPPRGQSRVRRPSEASSLLGGPPSMASGYGIPPSPGLPNGYDRPMAKQFQSNTIVPNKSTMVEEDDDLSPAAEAAAAFGLDHGSKASGPSENDKRLIEDYESQLRELRGKMEEMGTNMKKKEDEMNEALDLERSSATAANLERKEWGDVRLGLESQLAEAKNLNASMKEELDRIRDDHTSEVDQLRAQVEEYRQSSSNVSAGSASAELELEHENQALRMSLQEQQEVTEEVRQEAQDFLREMRLLSQQSSSAWEKQKELEITIEQLEHEVRDWRNRYARTKTQLRNMRASSMGLTIDQDAGKYVREMGFTAEAGLVKDVHVTKFQISIDELLRRARTDSPEKVIDSMKAVVVSVRRVTKDIDAVPLNDEDLAQRQAKLKGRVSSTANNLITAAKNYAASAGISPVSLLDAAASHLVSAMVELLRTVKIRPTPADELEDDDSGTITAADSTGMLSPRSHSQSQSIASVQDALPPPPPFQGLGGARVSAGSSAYSPINSPRGSVDRYSTRRPISRGSGLANGVAYSGMGENLPPVPNGYGPRQDSRNEDLKIYLEDQTAVLVHSIQNMVGSVRSDAPIDQITDEIGQIANVVGKVIAETEASGNGGASISRLAACLQRLQEAGDQGEDLAADGKGPGDPEWRMWTQTLPPIAFEIARESKELIQRVDQLVNGHGGDDFS